MPFLSSLVPGFLATRKGDDGDDDERDEAGYRISQSRIPSLLSRLFGRWRRQLFSSRRTLGRARTLTYPCDQYERDKARKNKTPHATSLALRGVSSNQEKMKRVMSK